MARITLWTSERNDGFIQGRWGVWCAKRSSVTAASGVFDSRLRFQRDPYPAAKSLILNVQQRSRASILILTFGNRWRGVGGTGNWAPEASRLNDWPRLRHLDTWRLTGADVDIHEMVCKSNEKQLKISVDKFK
jgi:hypothetical protein